MRLAEIRIHGYGKLVDTSCKVSGKLTAFIGPNEVGKSGSTRFSGDNVFGCAAGGAARPRDATGVLIAHQPHKAPRGPAVHTYVRRPEMCASGRSPAWGSMGRCLRRAPAHGVPPTPVDG